MTASLRLIMTEKNIRSDMFLCLWHVPLWWQLLAFGHGDFDGKITQICHKFYGLSMGIVQFVIKRWRTCLGLQVVNNLSAAVG